MQNHLQENGYPDEAIRKNILPEKEMEPVQMTKKKDVFLKNTVVILVPGLTAGSTIRKLNLTDI